MDRQLGGRACRQRKYQAIGAGLGHVVSDFIMRREQVRLDAEKRKHPRGKPRLDPRNRERQTIRRLIVAIGKFGGRIRQAEFALFVGIERRQPCHLLGSGEHVVLRLDGDAPRRRVSRRRLETRETRPRFAVHSSSQPSGRAHRAKVDVARLTWRRGLRQPDVNSRAALARRDRFPAAERSPASSVTSVTCQPAGAEKSNSSKLSVDVQQREAAPGLELRFRERQQHIGR